MPRVGIDNSEPPWECSSKTNNGVSTPRICGEVTTITDPRKHYTAFNMYTMSSLSLTTLSISVSKDPSADPPVHLEITPKMVRPCPELFPTYPTKENVRHMYIEDELACVTMGSTMVSNVTHCDLENSHCEVTV